MRLRGASWVVLLTLLGAEARADSPCARAIRDGFDRAGRIAASKPDDAALDQLGEQVRARPARCAPGDYSLFIQRYADLLIVAGQEGLTDRERKLLELVRGLAPRRVATSGYETAFHGFLDARARLASHAAPASSAELLTIFDSVRPEEILPTVALGRDRDGVIQGLAGIRRHLALGEVQLADAQAEELLRALQAELPGQPDGGAAPDAGAPDAGAVSPAATR